MSERLRERWTWDAYLAWEAKQEIRHEFVDGEVRAMTGGSLRHDTIAKNLRVALQGRGFWSHGPTLKVVTGSGNARYPDALVTSGLADRSTPIAVFDVLPHCAPWFDQALRWRDYDATPSIRYDVLISQDELRAMLYTRGEAGRLDIRDAQLIEGADGTIALPTLGVSITLGTLHEGLDT